MIEAKVTAAVQEAVAPLEARQTSMEKQVVEVVGGLRQLGEDLRLLLGRLPPIAPVGAAENVGVAVAAEGAAFSAGGRTRTAPHGRARSTPHVPSTLWTPVRAAVPDHVPNAAVRTALADEVTRADVARVLSPRSVCDLIMAQVRRDGDRTPTVDRPSPSPTRRPLSPARAPAVLLQAVHHPTASHATPIVGNYSQTGAVLEVVLLHADLVTGLIHIALCPSGLPCIAAPGEATPEAVARSLRLEARLIEVDRPVGALPLACPVETRVYQLDGPRLPVLPVWLHWVPAPEISACVNRTTAVTVSRATQWLSDTLLSLEDATSPEPSAPRKKKRKVKEPKEEASLRAGGRRAQGGRTPLVRPWRPDDARHRALAIFSDVGLTGPRTLAWALRHRLQDEMLYVTHHLATGIFALVQASSTAWRFRHTVRMWRQTATRTLQSLDRLVTTAMQDWESTAVVTAVQALCLEQAWRDLWARFAVLIVSAHTLSLACLLYTLCALDVLTALAVLWFWHLTIHDASMIGAQFYMIEL